MGQYFIPINITKREYISPWDCGNGGKWAEWVERDSSTRRALVAMRRGPWRGDRVTIVGDESTNTICDTGESQHVMYNLACETYTNVSEQAMALANKEIGKRLSS